MPLGATTTTDLETLGEARPFLRTTTRAREGGFPRAHTPLLDPSHRERGEGIAGDKTIWKPQEGVACNDKKKNMLEKLVARVTRFSVLCCDRQSSATSFCYDPGPPVGVSPSEE